MANVAQLIRRQSSRELLRVPLDRLELREMQHRLLPAGGEQSAGTLPLYGTANVAYVEEAPTATAPSNQQVRTLIVTYSTICRSRSNSPLRYR